MTKYVDTKFKLKDEREKEQMLVTEVDESKDEVLLYFATLSSYFENELKDMAKRIWPNKKIEIQFKSDIPLDYYSFRTFKEIVFK